MKAGGPRRLKNAIATRPGDREGFRPRCGACRLDRSYLEDLASGRQTALEAAFRRYTVSSYATSFDSYNGQSFQVSPAVRTLGNGEVIVKSRLMRADGSSVGLDYVMRRGPSGWQAVDVLTDGSISRVAVHARIFVNS